MKPISFCIIPLFPDEDTKAQRFVCNVCLIHERAMLAVWLHIPAFNFVLYLMVLQASASQSGASPVTVYAFLASGYYTWNPSAYGDPAESEGIKGLSIVVK